MNVKTRKVLALFVLFHVRSDIDRLYRKNNDGGGV